MKGAPFLELSTYCSFSDKPYILMVPEPTRVLTVGETLLGLCHLRIPVSHVYATGSQAGLRSVCGGLSEIQIPGSIPGLLHKSHLFMEPDTLHFSKLSSSI